jgi:L-serine dehydratase
LKQQPPSIFNDVIGPIMRGPSSSHTAAAVRIGKLLHQYYNGKFKEIMVEFDPQGSLATTYSSQGSDIGLAGGILDMDPADPGLLNALNTVAEKGVSLKFKITEFEANHPNTYRIRVISPSLREDCFIFISTGGGMIELQEINGLPVSIKGDYFETLLLLKSTDEDLVRKFKTRLMEEYETIDYFLVNSAGGLTLVDIKSTSTLPDISNLAHQYFPELIKVTCFTPVLPVRSNIKVSLPFLNAGEALENGRNKKRAPSELAIEYECARSGLTKEEIMEQGRFLIKVMRESVQQGFLGKKYEDRILGPQAVMLKDFKGQLVSGSVNKRVITYITAIMETKSSMGVIVAAPTAGSCAGLPGVLLAVADELGLAEDLIVRGLLAAGLIGVFISATSTFAAEECGCQAECGSGSGMAAAALVELAGGSSETAFSAASMALQNILGLVCDPVANRVEVPCLGKNVLAGMNALASADMALSGFDPVVPLDETIIALDQVGRLLPAELRCTGKGGLSITPASVALEKKFPSKS